MFNLGMKIFADAMSKNHKVYMYHFDYAPFEYKKSHKGVSHSSEIAYVFSTLPEGAQKDMKKSATTCTKDLLTLLRQAILILMVSP